MYLIYCALIYSNHWSPLHCTALHCTALHCPALHCTPLHYTALHCTSLKCTSLYCNELYYISLHYIVCTTLYCTKYTALYCTARRCITLSTYSLTKIHFLCKIFSQWAGCLPASCKPLTFWQNSKLANRKRNKKLYWIEPQLADCRSYKVLLF